MKVKEVMLTAATELGIVDDVRAYIDEGNEKGKKQAELLLECFNLVENELALDYLPLVKKESYIPQAGKVFYTQFSSPVARILSVENGFGEEIEFRVFATYLEVDATVVNVRYAYAPTEKTMSGESDYQFAASERLLAFGMAAEYLAALGLLEEASVWDKKYKEGIQAAMEWEQKCQADRDAAFAGETEDEAEQEKESASAPNAAGTMPTRRWV